MRICFLYIFIEKKKISILYAIYNSLTIVKGVKKERKREKNIMICISFYLLYHYDLVRKEVRV